MDRRQRVTNKNRSVASVPYRKSERTGPPKVDPRKKQLERYLAKEEQRSKKGRLSEILVQRLQNKYPGSMNKIVIISFVEEFIATHDRVSEQDLVALERDVREAVKNTAARQKALKAKGNEDTTARGAVVDNVAAEGAANGTLKKSESGASRGGEGNNGPNSPSITPGQEWVVLQGYNLVKADEDKRQEEEKARKKKSDFKSQLDEHVAIARKLKESENADENKYYKHIMSDIDKWRAEEKAKAEVIEKKAQVQLAIQKEQMALKKERLASEKAKEYSDANRDIQRIRKEVEDEEMAIQEQKRADLERNAKVKALNDKNLILKEEAKKKLQEEDTARMKEAMARQLKEEKDREAAFENRMKEMEKYGAKFAEEGAGKKQREMEIEMERIQIRDQMAKYAADEAREAEKERKRKEDIKHTLDYNQNIIDRRKREAEEQAEADRRYQNFLKSELDAWKQSEQNKIEERKKKNLDYRAMLDEHNRIRATKDVNLTGMGQIELEINGQMLRKVTQDSSLYDKIQNKLTGKDRPPLSKKAAAQKSRKPY